MINTIDGIISAARGGKTGVIAVAAAHDQPVIEAVVEARKEGIATPILVGHVDEIKSMLTGLGEDPAAYEIIAGDTDQDCAAKAVALCAQGKANFLMKGILGTADLMRAVFNKEQGLRTSHLTTHCMLYEIPALGRMLVLTDGGVSTPSLIWARKQRSWRTPPWCCRHWAMSTSTPPASAVRSR